MQWSRKSVQPVLEEKEKAGVVYLSFPALEQTGLVNHGFSTRLGGVSKPPYDTMNFSFSRGDSSEAVLENYSRMAAALGVRKEEMVVSHQTHTTNIRQVTKEDAGKGVVRERDYSDIDGLMTNVPGITLVTFYADCVPLYFLDPVHQAVGLSHSGWRGTVNRMGKVTLEAMAAFYGTRPEDVIACIGPSICQDCYEIGGEVAEEFQSHFRKECHDQILLKKENGKYQLDLWAANEIILKEAGVPESQIFTTDICTHCNPKLLFSHRRTGNARGNLAAFLGLKEIF